MKSLGCGASSLVGVRAELGHKKGHTTPCPNTVLPSGCRLKDLKRLDIRFRFIVSFMLLLRAAAVEEGYQGRGSTKAPHIFRIQRKDSAGSFVSRLFNRPTSKELRGPGQKKWHRVKIDMALDTLSVSTRLEGPEAS
jgi:hypothetical protein